MKFDDAICLPNEIIINDLTYEKKAEASKKPLPNVPTSLCHDTRFIDAKDAIGFRNDQTLQPVNPKNGNH